MSTIIDFSYCAFCSIQYLNNHESSVLAPDDAITSVHKNNFFRQVADAILLLQRQKR
jgi:hypothetical protein